jgi:hypothetical protein
LNDTVLRRYTDLPALIYLLREQKITLLDPGSWDDSNDSHYLTLYQKKKKLKSVLALCFTQAGETYHHWRVFANGSSGVCISFRRAELLEAVRKQSNVRTAIVKYLTLNKVRGRKLETEELPFLKRYAFENEDEFRVIYDSRSVKLSKLDIPIPLSCIIRINLSPWIHKSLSPHVRQILKAIPDCKNLKIARSTLRSNEEWKKLAELAK